jgi:hypothetical protein
MDPLTNMRGGLFCRPVIFSRNAGAFVRGIFFQLCFLAGFLLRGRCQFLSGTGAVIFLCDLGQPLRTSCGAKVKKEGAGLQPEGEIKFGLLDEQTR